jgi:hypothetical protein
MDVKDVTAIDVTATARLLAERVVSATELMAMVYPTLLAAITDHTHPTSRATSLGVYRFWRDSGYAIGALPSGIVADFVGLGAAIHIVAGLTLLSGRSSSLTRWANGIRSRCR